MPSGGDLTLRLLCPSRLTSLLRRYAFLPPLPLPERRRSSHTGTRAWWGTSDSKSIRFSRFGAERHDQHDRNGHGRGPAPPAPQRQHGRLWELGGKPGFDQLAHAPAPSSSPEGKSAGIRNVGFLKKRSLHKIEIPPS